MQAIKVMFAVFLMIIILSATYLETIHIPILLSESVGSLGVFLHIGSIAILISVGAYFSRLTIYSVFDRLMKEHVNTLYSTIGNLTTGYWHADASVNRGIANTALKIGYNLRDEVTEPDRNLIVDGINRLALPQVKQANGQSQAVINEMDQHMDDIQSRKNRLSEL
jgi:hypothetical protein